MTGSVVLPVKALRDEPADAQRGVRPARADLPGRAAGGPARRSTRRARWSRRSRSCCSRSRSGSRPTTGCSCSRASRRRATPARTTASRWRSGSSARAASSRTPRCCSCVAIGAFATSQVVFIKELGVGTALAVLIDAFIVRALLVPSLMVLLGSWNWWAPRPLARLHARLRLGEVTCALRLPRTRLQRRRPPREPAGGGRGPVDARRRGARLLLGVRDRAGRRGARPARVLQRVRADRDAAGAGGTARRVQGGRARARARARRRSDTGPRPIDVDVLLLEDVEHESERLRLPHREVLTRRFVLVPLLELDPGSRDPGRRPGGRRARARSDPGQEVRRAGPPLDVGS